MENLPLLILDILAIAKYFLKGNIFQEREHSRTLELSGFVFVFLNLQGLLLLLLVGWLVFAIA